jgi:hypothetical protein
VPVENRNASRPPWNAPRRSRPKSLVQDRVRIGAIHAVAAVLVEAILALRVETHERTSEGSVQLRIVTLRSDAHVAAQLRSAASHRIARAVHAVARTRREHGCAGAEAALAIQPQAIAEQRLGVRVAVVSADAPNARE